MVGLQEVRGVGVSHSLLQDRQTGYVQAAGAHISPAACHKIWHVLILQCTRVCLFGGFLQSGLFIQVCQCEELWKEFKLLFHCHGLSIKGLWAFMSVMAWLSASEANCGMATSSMSAVNIHQSRADLWRSGDQVPHWGSQKHLMCQNKDSSKFCDGWSGCMVAYHTSVYLYKGLVHLLVLKHPLSSFRSLKSRAPSLSSTTWFWSAGSSPRWNWITMVISSLYSTRSMSSWNQSM